MEFFQHDHYFHFPPVFTGKYKYFLRNYTDYSPFVFSVILLKHYPIFIIVMILFYFSTIPSIKFCVLFVHLLLFFS
jgi:hypothetical protein